MTTAVTSKTTGEIIAYTPPEEGWESDGNEDIAPSFPTITIVQPTSRMPGAEKHVGEFWHSDRETYEPELSVVGLVKRETRAMFAEGSDTPVCMSSDGKAPHPNMPLWRMESVKLRDGDKSVPFGVAPSACEMCPFSQWLGDSPPACQASYVILVDRGDDDLAQLRIKGKSIKPYREFVKRKLAPKRLPLFLFRLHLSGAVKSDVGKKWAELAIDAEPLNQEDALRYNEILRSHRSRFEHSVASSVEWDDEQHPDAAETTAFMAELTEVMGEYMVRPVDVAKYMKATFSEANVSAFIDEKGYADIDAFIAEVQRKTPVVQPESLPFE